MRHALLSLATVLSAIAVTLAAPPEVKFPEVSAPTPAPAAVATLTADRLFVIESKEKLVILSSPAGMVKVTAEAGPLTVFSRFADGGDRAEKRTYQGPFVFLLEPIKSGECELLVIPEKVTGEGDILRRQLKVEAGEGPRPPPKPDPVITDRLFWVVAVEESADRTPDTAKVLGDLKYWQSLLHKWRHYDRDSEAGKGYAKKAGEKNVTLPALLLYAENAKSGDEPVAVVPLPKSTAGVSETIKANGGKR
jgi:hypothetical protein